MFQILTPFLLRRLKSDVTLEVPPKKEIIVYAPLTAKQEAFYTAVVNKTITKMLGQEKVTPCCIHLCGVQGRTVNWSLWGNFPSVTQCSPHS